MLSRILNVGVGRCPASVTARWKSTGDLMKDCGWDKLARRANKVKEAETKDPKVEMGQACESQTGHLPVPLTESEIHDLSVLDMTPPDVLARSVAIIRRRPKLVTQQGTDNVGTWELTFATKERWENPCMGWCSASYPYSNISMYFGSAEEAAEFSKKRGWCFEIEDDSKHTKPKKQPKKWYGENFAWDKRLASGQQTQHSSPAEKNKSSTTRSTRYSKAS